MGLGKNTLILFTSDNGPHKEGGADPDFFNSNGIYRGYKRDLYEGGIHVPMIAKWQGVIQENTRTDHISAFWDVLPTLADVVNFQIIEDIDGVSFLPTLTGKKTQKSHSHLYWEFHEKGGRQALRQKQWKLVKYNIRKGGKYELYNLVEDPGETINLADSMKDKVTELAKILESSRTPSDIYKFSQTAFNGEK